jgi:hypothetical protein
VLLTLREHETERELGPLRERTGGRALDHRRDREAADADVDDLEGPGGSGGVFERCAEQVVGQRPDANVPSAFLLVHVVEKVS